ncbi:MAG: outer membrane beta-barrel protein [Bdellovibrionales bacterium]|nr:outer membrane beta-barrel protein [Bdellovibrionales bacterium]
MQRLYGHYYQNSPQAHAPVAPAMGPSYLEGRVFDNQHNVMTLNMVEVSAKRKVGEVSFRIDLAFGQMVDGLAGSGSLANGQPATANSTEPTRNVTQATIGYSPSQIPKLTITVGKFYSMIGYETTKAKDNMQYSRSLSFNYAIPYWHEGASFSYGVVPDKFNATVQVLNSWDGRISAENNMSPTLALGLNTTPASGFAANYNFMTGKESSDPDATRQLHELNLTYAIIPEVSVAADYVLALQKHAIATDSSSAEWKTLALYVKYTPVSWYTLSPRYEIFDDSDKGFALSGFSGAGGIQQKITSFTVANNFAISEGLEGRLEYRSDKSNKDGYYKDSNGNSTDQQDSYTVSLLASF